MATSLRKIMHHRTTELVRALLRGTAARFEKILVSRHCLDARLYGAFDAVEKRGQVLDIDDIDDGVIAVRPHALSLHDLPPASLGK
jgi:hypothetical protein